jgi:hypothetical protein
VPRGFGFHGWDLPIVLAAVAAIAAAITLLVVGAAMVASGESKIASANAYVAQQNARACGGDENGTGPVPSCDFLAPGVDQPEGVAGQQEVDLGGTIALESLMPFAVLGALGILQLWRWGRMER